MRANQLISLSCLAAVSAFLTFGGMYLAVKALSVLTYTLSTGAGGFVWGWVSTHVTQKTLPRLVGKKQFEKQSRLMTFQLEEYRGVIFGGLMALTWLTTYYLTPIIQPYIPAWLSQGVAYVSQASSGEQSLFLAFAIIFLLLLLGIGIYNLHGQQETEQLRAENAKLRRQIQRREPKKESR